jgi:hypothetical protein
VKSAEKGGVSIDPHGYDAGKKIKGKKRHVLVDTQGLLLHAIVHAADIQDRDGGVLLMSTLFGLYADSNEGGHLFQSDRGHHSNLMAASLVSSHGPVLVMSWRRSPGQVVAPGLLHQLAGAVIHQMGQSTILINNPEQANAVAPDDALLER